MTIIPSLSKPGKTLNRLQHVQNSAARVLNHKISSTHYTCTVRWLPVLQRIRKKLLLLTYKDTLYITYASMKLQQVTHLMLLSSVTQKRSFFSQKRPFFSLIPLKLSSCCLKTLVKGLCLGSMVFSSSSRDLLNLQYDKGYWNYSGTLWWPNTLHFFL